MPRSQSRSPAARPPAGGTPRPRPRGPRTADQAKAEHRGGEWGRGVVARLWALKGVTGANKWADRVGLSRSLVSSYLNGTRLPGAESLRTIAESTGVSLDWLLLGDGGDEPVKRGYSGERRTQDELEADVAAHVKGALGVPVIPDDVIVAWYRIAEELAPEALNSDAGDPGEQLSALLGVDGGAILRGAVDQARQDRERLLTRHYEFARVGAAALPLGRAYLVECVRRWARVFAPFLPVTADALNRFADAPSFAAGVVQIVELAPRAAAEIRAHRDASQRGELRFPPDAGERPREWDMSVGELFRPDVAMDGALQFLFQQLEGAVAANQRRTEGAIMWPTFTPPPSPEPIRLLGTALDAGLSALGARLVGAR